MKNKTLLASGILGFLYATYILVYFYGSGDAMGMLAGAIVMPHAIAVLVGATFAMLASQKESRTFALVSGITYSVSAVIFMLYAIMVLPMIILSFVGFAKMPKKVEAQ